MATAVSVVGSGSQSPSSVSRTIERIFDDSQHTGDINLSGRKLKRYPSSANKYDLIDTTNADISKNRFTEIPEVICDYVSIERLNCYHNVIRCLPRAIVQLQSLVYLNLSRNQLSSLPPFLNQLEELRVLLVNNNKLLSLPDEITELKNLTELDVSCNEISHLPNQMCRLSALRSLNLRKNLLLQLPFGLMQLKLRKLDISSNRIAHIPLDFHKMNTIEELYLENNPLLTPPSSISTRGLVHIMKYLSNELHPGEKKILQNEARLRNRIKRSLSLSTASPEGPGQWWNMVGREKLKQTATVDSGYNTTAEGSEKSRWSSTEVSPLSPEEIGNLATTSKTADSGASESCCQPVTTNSSVADPLWTKPSTVETKPNQPILASASPVDAISMELERQKADYAARKKKAEELKAMLEADNERRKLMSSKEKEKSQGVRSRARISDLDARMAEVREKSKTLPAQTSADCMSPLKRNSHVGSSASTPCAAAAATNTRLDAPLKQDAVGQETKRGIEKLEEKVQTAEPITNGCVPEDIKETPRPKDEDHGHKASVKETGTPKSSVVRVTSRSTTSTIKSSTSTLTAFATTSQRALEVLEKEVIQVEASRMANGKQALADASNEEELTKELRKIIESKLKIKLPQDINEGLQDGVILCHLANHLRPRSIMCIHIPSPAVPKLSQAKCRRNVDNFLLACRRMGLDQSRICSSSVILEKRGIVAVTEMVKAMIDGSSKSGKQRLTTVD